MITGLAALNKANQTTPGDDIRVGPGWRKADGKGKKNGDDERIPAFMPGQRMALANQLATGFGGGATNWEDYLNSVYNPLTIRPFTPGKKPAGNKTGNKNGLPVVGSDGASVSFVTGLPALVGRR